jgi:Uma2 family endonuclease
MSTAVATPSRPLSEEVDHQVVLHGLSWTDYERLLAIRGQSAGVRMTYLEGELELVSPSRKHEGITTTIGRLIEAYAEERGIDLNGFGSWTIRSRPKERGVEPDKCYILGDPGEKRKPDLAIEVEWTRGLVDKLEVYRGLGVGELWVWRRGRIEVHVLRRARYERAEKSALLPQLDLQALGKYLAYPSQTQAVRAFRASLRRRA